MGNSLTSNEFLFSFEGRINRAKYWYAVFASSAACLVFLSVVAFAIGGIFGSKIKSVHADLFDFLSKLPSFPFTISFRDAAPTPAATVLFYVTGSPIFVVSVWFLAAPTIQRLHHRTQK